MTNDRKDLRFSESTRISLPAALLIASGIFLVGTGALWGNLKSNVDKIPELERQLAAHDKELGRLDVIANDIAWIKKELSRRKVISEQKPGSLVRLQDPGD